MSVELVSRLSAAAAASSALTANTTGSELVDLLVVPAPRECSRVRYTSSRMHYPARYHGTRSVTCTNCNLAW